MTNLTNRPATNTAGYMLPGIIIFFLVYVAYYLPCYVAFHVVRWPVYYSIHGLAVPCGSVASAPHVRDRELATIFYGERLTLLLFLLSGLVILKLARRHVRPFRTRQAWWFIIAAFCRAAIDGVELIRDSITRGFELPVNAAVNTLLCLLCIITGAVYVRHITRTYALIYLLLISLPVSVLCYFLWFYAAVPSIGHYTR